MIKTTVLFPISHDCQISFQYIIVISLYVLAELGYVLSVILKEERKCIFENALVEKSESPTNLK